VVVIALFVTTHHYAIMSVRPSVRHTPEFCKTNERFSFKKSYFKSRFQMS